MRIKKFYEYILSEDMDGGGGVAMATNASNGSGYITAPTVGITPGSVWGQGSGTIGSGDIPNGKSEVYEIVPKKIKKKLKKKQKKWS